MPFSSGLSTAEIRTILASEIESAGGTLSDCFDDGARLFARSILPWVSEVRPQDRVQGGVALRATENEVWVHPYVFRQICRNGQIVATAIASRMVALNDAYSTHHAMELLRDAVRACADKEVFGEQADIMRSLPQNPVDYMLFMMPFVAKLPSTIRSKVLADINQRFEIGNDRSQYGILNATTSLARDTQDPELRWRLEELGGAVLVCGPRTPKRPTRRVSVREMAMV